MQRQKETTMKAMKSAKADAARTWREIEEQWIPALRPWPVERLIYFYLVRQTRLAGRRSLLISATQLARAVAFAPVTVRVALRRLRAKGAVRVIERGRQGQRIAVRLPGEIPGCAPRARDTRELDIETADFAGHQRLRAAIYRREKNRCFYCGSKLHYGNRTLDHVVSRAEGGGNGYRNVVACCVECNSSKAEMHVAEFLRTLARRGVLSARAHVARVKAVERLISGKSVPIVSL
jgi:DNA-binding transcriptional ArsR family regulator